MGTHLPRLALLLAVLQYAAVLVAPTGLLIDELLTHGGRRTLRAYNKKYLTGTEDHTNEYVLVQDGPPVAENHWTIVQISDTEVALRAANGMYLRQSGTMDLAKQVDTWEKWTPVKNEDGTWSFQARRNDRWLSAYDPKGYVYGGDYNKKCEKWTLETWELEPHMAELLSNGGRRFLKAKWNDKYLTGETEHFKSSVAEMRKGPLGDANHWTFVQINDKEVAIRAANGKFLRHVNPMDLTKKVDDWVMWTPVKNGDGTWSFRSQDGNWLSAHNAVDNYLYGVAENSACEKWILETWELEPQMVELLANNGRRTLKSCNGKYIIEQEDTTGGILTSCKRSEIVVKDGPPGDRNHWTMVQKSDKEVALRAANGMFLRHSENFWVVAFLDLQYTVDDWEMWTPVKNEDGSFSFKSRYDPGWLSAYRYLNFEGYFCPFPYVKTEAENNRCEKWWLEPY